MDLAYAAADLVVSRAGAMTCTELLATGKPAILVQCFLFLFFGGRLFELYYFRNHMKQLPCITKL